MPLYVFKKYQSRINRKYEDKLFSNDDPVTFETVSGFYGAVENVFANVLEDGVHERNVVTQRNFDLNRSFSRPQ